MTSRSRNRRSPLLGLAAVLMLLPSLVLAADQRRKVPEPWQFNPDDQTVEMFQAMEEGLIDVKLIPKDATECQMLIENKADKPLNVRLPEAFAGVPVLAQDLGGGLGNLGGANRGWSSGGGQGYGGGAGMFNVPPEQIGKTPPMLNVPPEKVGKLKMPIVCLEHGKPDPRPAMPYKIVPIDQFTDKKEVHELCRMLGTGQIDQRAAQVAAWHLNNEMSWLELAAKRLKHANGTSQPYFNTLELRAGIQLAAMASNLVQQRQKLAGESESPEVRPGKETSLSSN